METLGLGSIYSFFFEQTLQGLRFGETNFVGIKL